MKKIKLSLFGWQVWIFKARIRYQVRWTEYKPELKVCMRYFVDKRDAFDCAVNAAKELALVHGGSGKTTVYRIVNGVYFFDGHIHANVFYSWDLKKNKVPPVSVI